MIFITGDTHGTLDLQKIFDFFEGRTNLTKSDYLIILGDVGVVWDGGIHDANIRELFHKLPVSVLFVDGNHENHDLLRSLPVEQWNGGQVHKIEPDIIHLMRGQVFNIKGKTFFTFGGGYSLDKMHRTEGISWWEREMPSDMEYKTGIKNLEAVNHTVDYILTHTAPRKVISKIMSFPVKEEKELNQYLQRVSEWTDFSAWYFGHFHQDIVINDKYFGLYNKIIEL